MDKSGKALFPSEYSFIWELEADNEGVFYEVTIRESGRPSRSGIVDEKGNVILPCNYGIPIGTSRVSIKKRVFVFEDGSVEVQDSDEGNTVAEMLEYVQLDPEVLLTRFRDQVRKTDLAPELQTQFLDEFESGLYGYTYLEDE